MPVKERTVGVVGFHKGIQIFFYSKGLFFIGQRLGKPCLLFRIAAAGIGIEGGKVFASALSGAVIVEIQERQCDLSAFVAVCFDSLHVGRKLSVAVQVPHALQHVVPRDCLCEWGIPCGSSPTDANSLIVVPGSVFFSIHDKAVAAVILTPQDIHKRLAGLFREPVGIRSMPGVEGCDNVHPALCRIGAEAQKIVDDLLGNRRSEGRSLCALRFLDDLKLFRFGREKAELCSWRLHRGSIGQT